MYSKELVIDLAGKVIQAYHFDYQHKFAGFALEDLETGVREQIIAPELDWGEINTYEVEEDLLYGPIAEHTRLVGFRTGLSCRTSQTIM